MAEEKRKKRTGGASAGARQTARTRKAPALEDAAEPEPGTAAERASGPIESSASAEPVPSSGETAETEAAPATRNPDDFAAPGWTSADEAAEEEAIRRRAYRIWEEEGRPQGREREHWERAEREVREERGRPA